MVNAEDNVSLLLDRVPDGEPASDGTVPASAASVLRLEGRDYFVSGGVLAGHRGFPPAGRALLP